MELSTDDHRLVPADHVLVLFGATGDLARRKLLPGLFHLATAGLMPAGYRIIGSSPPGSGPSADFADFVRSALQEHGRKEVTAQTWSAFGDALSFVEASADDSDELCGEVAAAGQGLADPQRLIYLAVPPGAFIPMIEMLGRSGLAQGAKLIIEKPFGTDLRSARELNAALHRVFEESQVFRIDHFLGKEAVQNILALRFANELFEPAWDREHVDHVQIDVPEELTIEGRAGFYEATGAFRDMVVTHLFQLLGFVAMEPPHRLDAESLQQEKLRVFEAMEPLEPSRVVYGQYDGYRSEPGVAQGSQVETFVAAEVRIDNERWAGVPFQLRTGKGMAESRLTVTLSFREPPLHMFELGDAERELSANRLVLELADPAVITARFLAKTPGPSMDLGDASFVLRYSDSFTVSKELEAYERLIHDVMIGDHTLFNRAAGIERLWEVSTPLLESPPAPEPYEVGSWGPDTVNSLVAPRTWHLPDS